MPDAEHHEHQRPAAADAERPVRDAHRERLAPRVRAAPARDDEAERRPALVEAAVAERAELPQPGDREGRAEDQLRVLGEPRQRIDRRVDPAVEDPRRRARTPPTPRDSRRAAARRAAAGVGRRRTSAPNVTTSGMLDGSIIARIIRTQPAVNSAASTGTGAAPPASWPEVRPVGRARPRHEADPGQRRQRDEGRAEHGPVAARVAEVRRGEHRPCLRPRSGSGPGGRCCRRRRRRDPCGRPSRVK